MKSDLGSTPGTYTYQLCVLGEVSGPLCACFLIQKVGMIRVPTSLGYYDAP